jgi:hypothetical protein
MIPGQISSERSLERAGYGLTVQVERRAAERPAYLRSPQSTATDLEDLQAQEQSRLSPPLTGPKRFR